MRNSSSPRRSRSACSPSPSARKRNPAAASNTARRARLPAIMPAITASWARSPDVRSASTSGANTSAKCARSTSRGCRRRRSAPSRRRRGRRARTEPYSSASRSSNSPGRAPYKLPRVPCSPRLFIPCYLNCPHAALHLCSARAQAVRDPNDRRGFFDMAFLADALSRVKPSATIAVTQKARELKAQGRDDLGLVGRRARFRHARQHQAGGDRGDRARRDQVSAGARHPAAARGDRRKSSSARTGSTTRPTQTIVGTGGKQILFNAFLATLNRGRRGRSSPRPTG